jgi:hypothetical protein
MTGTDLCVKKSQFVPVIFEPPCTPSLIRTPSSVRGREKPLNVFFKQSSPVNCLALPL